MQDSVIRKVSIHMLMTLADGLGLGTYSTYYLFLATFRDAPLTPCLKVRMVKFRDFSVYNTQASRETHNPPVLTRGRYDKIFKITQLELNIQLLTTTQLLVR